MIKENYIKKHKNKIRKIKKGHKLSKENNDIKSKINAWCEDAN